MSSPHADGVVVEEQSFANFDRRIALSFGALILALMITVLLAGGLYYRGIAEREQAKLSALVTHILAKSVSRISFSGKYHARLLLEEIARGEPDIRYILVADKQGNVLASSDPSRNDTRLDQGALEAAMIVLSGEPRKIRGLAIHDEPIREITESYLSGFDNEIAGVIQVGLSDRARLAAMHQGLFFVGVLVLLLTIIGIVVTRRISQRFGRPVIHLASDLSATLQAIPDLMFELNQEGRYLKVMAARDMLMAMPGEALLGRTVGDVLPAQAAETVLIALATANEKGSAYGCEISLPLAEGMRWFELSVAKKAVPAGEMPRYIVLSRDITERKRAVDEIHSLAFYDPLTRLPNRRLLHDRLQQSQAASMRGEHNGALMFIDLDHFKTLNDTKGHGVGDLLLQKVAQRLQDGVRDGDTVARLGGDEFVVILESLSSDADEAAAQAGFVAEKLRSALEQPYQLKEHEYHSTPSIGVTLFQGHGERVEDLLKHADTALYQAKSAGRNTIRFFDPDMQAVLEARTEMIGNLRQALKHQQLRLFYQTQVDSAQRVIGAEALLRWETAEHGLISPAQFIPLAEETGLIVPIGLWVLKTACEQIRFWSGNPATRGLQLAVNVSACQFRQADFVEQVQQVINAAGIDPTCLKIELTESLVLDNMGDSIPKMQALKAIGIGLSMDDFGTGYSSLSYLKQLPLDQLKIDQSFVRDLVTDPNDAAIVQAIITMGQTFGLNVIAEGVETEAQRDFLAMHGCHAFQGYLFSKPVPIEQFDAFSRQG
ncbi:MAG: EAL domain-containing protein [Sulfurimicrobium sp.]|jgi:diguanylate cyclase (GGDEF)-like protein|nr:EAL domain-containing protein [Sulfurimicrobium sp.]MDP1706135.1 EAL domain-containing protein [Sulfurimicrobium sp.]MDP2197054.1 EAL domain-containing protein [Sulfurimicrobium sp.]MDZ7657028.1 EAL domain-containing protein [Sulfurimicrobium sp.]